MKRWFAGISFSIFSIIATASAYGYTDFRSASSDIIRWIQDIFGPFFEALLGASSFSADFFARVLFLILIFVVTYSVLNTRVKIFKDSKVSSAIVAIAFSLLGVRYISEFAFFSYILLPNQIFAIGLFNGLILLIVFYFIQSNDDRNARRIMWLVFLAVLFAIWMERRTELGSANWIYGIIFFVGLLALILDGFIHGHLRYSEWKRKAIRRRIVSIQNRLNDITNNNSTEAQEERRDLHDELRKLNRQL